MLQLLGRTEPKVFLSCGSGMPQDVLAGATVASITLERANFLTGLMFLSIGGNSCLVLGI